jgi:5'-deoxynucleotidase YfbR-like HD superfamily hydrolase
MKNILDCSDEEILAEAHKLRVGYGMKRVIRYVATRDPNVHAESDAEHVFALIYLAQYFLHTEPSVAGLDKEKLNSIFLFHDFGEIKYGDINTYDKTDDDRARELEAAQEVLASLPEAIQQIARDSWQEYEERKTPEAKFVHALDKIEPMFELLDPVNERSVKRLKITYEMHVGNKFPLVQNYPVMKRFVEVISKDMQQRGVFWEG